MVRPEEARVPPESGEKPHPKPAERPDFERISQATDRVKEEVERLVEGFDITAIGARIEEFGKEKPLALAIGALALGVAAGYLVRSGNHPSRS